MRRSGRTFNFSRNFFYISLIRSDYLRGQMQQFKAVRLEKPMFTSVFTYFIPPEILRTPETINITIPPAQGSKQRRERRQKRGKRAWLGTRIKANLYSRPIQLAAPGPDTTRLILTMARKTACKSV